MKTSRFCHIYVTLLYMSFHNVMIYCKPHMVYLFLNMTFTPRSDPYDKNDITDLACLVGLEHFSVLIVLLK